jgi:hypothetical protein
MERGASPRMRSSAHDIRLLPIANCRSGDSLGECRLQQCRIPDWDIEELLQCANAPMRQS